MRSPDLPAPGSPGTVLPPRSFELRLCALKTYQQSHSEEQRILTFNPGTALECQDTAEQETVVMRDSEEM